MITRSIIWSRSSLWSLLLLPLSLLYGLITAVIRFSYHCGWRKVHRFPLPIVVIGNLTIGGNGKTPVVLWLVEQLKQRGWRVGVVSRGYGGQSSRYPLTLNVSISSAECGDEPLLIWQRTGIPVVVAPRRADAVAALLQAHMLDIIIADDGLQHYALARDIEWVVIDGECRFGNGWLLPAGPMRELASRIKKVQVVIVNGGKVQPGEVQMQLQPGKAINLLSGKQCALNCIQKVIAIAGIGYPQRFFATLRANGIIPLKEVSFADHQVYYEPILAELTPGNEMLLMTEKDAIKCRAFAHKNWWYLPVDVIFPETATKQLLEPIEQSINNYRKVTGTECF